jgi:hypothetical protein
MMVASTDRPDIADTSQATADELRALWNPMVANAGATFGSRLKCRSHPLWLRTITALPRWA